MNRLTRFLRRRRGRIIILLILLFLPAAIIVGQLIGFWNRGMLFGTAGGDINPEIMKIEAEWPQYMHADEADSIRVSLIRTSEQLFVPTIEVEGHAAEVATPIPYGTPGAPIDTAFGDQYRVSAVARLDAVAFSCSPSTHAYQSLGQSRIDWVWNCVANNPGDQCVNASVYIRWEPINGDGDIIERQIWRSRFDIPIEDPLLTTDHVTLFTLVSGLLGSVFTTPWVYQRLKKKQPYQREEHLGEIGVRIQNFEPSYVGEVIEQEGKLRSQQPVEFEGETRRFSLGLPGIVEGMEMEGRYQILKCLGRGGMGAAYLALQKDLDRQCVIKEVLSQDISNREQFEREAKMLASLSHPNLPTVYDYFLYKNCPFLVLQFIEGETLEHLASKRLTSFSVSDVLKWTRQLLGALQYIHSQEPPIIHRDIKPGNICITPQGNAVLLDFGIARRLDETHTYTGAQALTASYAPIEQWYDPRGAVCVLEYVKKLQDQNIHTGPYTDIYSLGGTIYFALTLYSPTNAPLRILGEPMRLIQNANPEVTDALADVVMKALQLHPSERYQSAAEMLAALPEE
ncbi:MAG: serine/threonine protein kinase [Anaerolineales bacterium]|nr:serine/threonine protein kinase [Anaerolineales bacterium]